MSINMQDYWYSPAYVISMAQELIMIYGQEIIDKDSHNFQKVGEMKSAAIMLLALHKVFNHHFFMQASKDSFPDVWSLYQEKVVGKSVDTKYQTIEVVTYEEHTNSDVADFILASKLINSKKAYDEETIILCYIRKGGTYINFNALHEKHMKYKFKPTRVFIIGNMLDFENIFILSQVWPDVHHEPIDLTERVKAYPLPHRMLFTKGISNIIDYSKNSTRNPIDPYKAFYINEKIVKEKYKR